MDLTFVYAKSVLVTGIRTSLPDRSINQLSPALLDLRQALLAVGRQHRGPFKWMHVHAAAVELGVTSSIWTLRTLLAEMAGATSNNLDWPSYVRVRQGLYVFTDTNEVGVGNDAASCRDEVVATMRSLEAEGRGSEFTWQEVWDEMARRGTSYKRATVRRGDDRTYDRPHPR